MISREEENENIHLESLSRSLSSDRWAQGFLIGLSFNVFSAAVRLFRSFHHRAVELAQQKQFSANAPDQITTK